MQAAEKKQYLDTAITLAEAAGPIALKYFRRGAAVADKGSEGRFDPVTAADREIETFLRQEIAKRHPGHGVIGEEHGVTEAAGALSWIIDPIDGTRAFISGMPAWGIMIGLLENGEPQVGVVHQPFTSESFSGDGAGAWYTHRGVAQPIRSRDTEVLADAVLYCTHPSMFSGAAVSAFERVASACRMSRFGGDCYSYCLVAMGEVDLVIESGLQPYDILPLMPILEGAGAVVSDWRGDSAIAGGSVIAAATVELRDAAIAVLGEAASQA